MKFNTVVTRGAPAKPAPCTVIARPAMPESKPPIAELRIGELSAITPSGLPKFDVLLTFATLSVAPIARLSCADAGAVLGCGHVPMTCCAPLRHRVEMPGMPETGDCSHV